MGWQSPNFRISAPRSHAQCPMATPTLEAGACWSLLKHYPTEWKIFYQNTTFSTQISGINLILCAGLVAGPLGCVRGRGWECHGAPHVLPPPAILLSLQPTGRPFCNKFLAGIQHFWQYIFGRNSTFLEIEGSPLVTMLHRRESELWLCEQNLLFVKCSPHSAP